MWRMKVTAVSLVVMGALLFGSAIAFAGWGWNAKVDVEGTKISTSWSVTDDKNGAADYIAEITLTVPMNTDVNVIKVAPRETMEVVYTNAACTGDDVNAVVSYLVTGHGDGSDVSVSVDRVGGGGKHNYGSASGQVNSELPVTVDVVLKGACNS